MANYEGYCVKCREKREFDGQEVELANGQFDFLPVEFALFATLHAVTLVVSHDNSSSR